MASASQPTARLRAVLENPTHRTSFVAATLIVLAFRSRLFTLPGDVIHKFRSNASEKGLASEDLSQALQQIYTKDVAGNRTLLVPTNDGRIGRVPFHPISPSTLAKNAAHFPPLSSTNKTKPNIDPAFLRQLRAILFRVLFSSWRSKETLIVLLHSFFLIMRTVLSVAVARLDGRIVRDLIKADGPGFLRGIGLWFALAVPSTYTNAMIRHLQAKLSLHLRTKLTHYTQALYLSSQPDLRYYRIGHEGGLEGVDQYLTSDIEAWSDAIAGLYGNLMKPTLDIVLFTSQLSKTLGIKGTVMLILNYYITARVLRAVTPAFGRLAAIEARLEGEYRNGMGRVGRDSEEIAFYDGGAREKDILGKAYMKLIKHVNSIYKIRIAYEWTEDYLIKYIWSAAGYALIALPVIFSPKKRTMTTEYNRIASKQDDDSLDRETGDHAVASRTESYISNRRLLISLADAGGRIMYAYKDLLELAGLTTRLYTLLSTLHNLPPVTSTPTAANQDKNAIHLDHVDVGIPPSDIVGASEKPSSNFTLVKDLNLVLREGEHLMITGGNSTGKTAIARVLAGLWSPQGDQSSLSRLPPYSKDGSGNDRLNMYIVPQRAYMVTGSLLAQIIYPHSYADFLESGRTEDELMEILKSVFLEYLPAREGGWTTRKEWRDVLSGGEKQRMSLARVFYHRPRFAILDECTSAVSSDVEGKMYEAAKSRGITLITISLRPNLMKYHTQVLTLPDDHGANWTLTQLGSAEQRMDIDQEIVALEEKLKEVEQWESRVQELNAILRGQSGLHSEDDEMIGDFEAVEGSTE